MEDPCKLCLVQPACTIECKDSKDYKKCKTQIIDTIYIVIVIAFVSLFVFTMVGMMMYE